MKTKIIICIALLCAMLTGCDLKNSLSLITTSHDDTRVIACDSGVNKVAQIGNYIIGFSFYSYDVYYKNIETGEILPMGLKMFEEQDGDVQLCSIAASDDYLFLVYAINSGYDYYLQIYDENLNLLKNVKVPFCNISYNDGYIFGMYNQDSIQSLEWKCDVLYLGNINNNIVAGRYITEDELWDIDLRNIDEWHELTGDVVELGDTTLYRYDGDFWDSYDFYRNAVPYPMVRYLSYVKKDLSKYWSTNECTSVLEEGESKAFEYNLNNYISEIFDVLGKNPDKEAFSFSTLQNNDDIYAICNIYEDCNVQSFDCFETAYLLKYNKDTEKFEIDNATEKYNKYEVVYFDGEHVLYRYYNDLVYADYLSGETRVVYSSEYRWNINLNDGLIFVEELEATTSAPIINIVCIDKLW
jgi:hypothetical protein